MTGLVQASNELHAQAVIRMQEQYDEYKAQLQARMEKRWRDVHEKNG